MVLGGCMTRSRHENKFLLSLLYIYIYIPSQRDLNMLTVSPAWNVKENPSHSHQTQIDDGVQF